MARARAIWVLVLISMGACGSGRHRISPSSSRDGEDPVARARAALIAAVTSGDPAASAAIYAEDAILMNPNLPDVRGRANIEAFFRSVFAAVAIRAMTITLVDMTVSGNRACELSSFTQVVQPAGAPPAEDRGRVMLVWERDPDGTWRIRYALVNSSLMKSPLH